MGRKKQPEQENKISDREKELYKQLGEMTMKLEALTAKQIQVNHTSHLVKELSDTCKGCRFLSRCPFELVKDATIFKKEVHFCPKKDDTSERRFFLSNERLRKLERVHRN